MNKILFFTISFFLLISQNATSQQCNIAQDYVDKIQDAQDNWSPTKYASSGKKIQAWTQFGTWYAYKCQCESPENLSETEIPQLVNAMNATRGIISKEYSAYGNVPRVYKVSDCKKGNSNSSNSASSKTSTQIEMEQRFANYSNAKDLEYRGVEIAKAYANQVKNYSQLNQANTPEALLQNFNENMKAIADLQSQNKADNLNQVGTTLNSALNDLNSGNHEGALFSTLSLLEQGEAKREARRKVVYYKARLAQKNQKQMTAFYWKAVDLNNQAIDQYYQEAAFSYTKKEEDYLLEYINHHECFKQHMKNNFSYSNTSWTSNNCPIPNKITVAQNNLIAKDIQYIKSAKRKYLLYQKTGRPEFQQGAIKFAGLAATTNPKTEYFYLMGHYAGINNSLVAYASFLTVKNRNPNYFNTDKNAEFTLVKLSLEASFKEAIKENQQEVINNIVSAGLHQAVSIDESSPIVYAIKIDQADVVQAFLNTELEGKPQNIINTKVQEVIMLAALLDAPKTIQSLVDMGFSIDFTIDEKAPLDIAEEALSIKSFNKIAKLLGGQSEYTLANSDLVKIIELNKYANLNYTIKVTQIYTSLSNNQSKNKALEELLKTDNRNSFFTVYESDKSSVSYWVKEHRNLVYRQCVSDLFDRNKKNVWKYFSTNLIHFKTAKLEGEDLHIFLDTWVSVSQKYILMADNKRFVINKFISDQFLYTAFKYDESSILSKVDLKHLEHKSLLKLIINGAPPIHPAYRYFNSNEVNLIEYAIFERADPILLNTLLSIYPYEWDKTMGGHKTPFLREVICYSNAITIGYSYDPKVEFDILSSLIFEFHFEKNAFESIVENGIFYCGRDNNYQYMKALTDKLIDSGHHADLYINILKRHDHISRIQNDKKYWKAIFSGKYEKRY